jgi:hypothetical protein
MACWHGTFMAFVIVGFIPLIPFLLPLFNPSNRWLWSASLAALTFAGIGLIKSLALEHSKWRLVLGTLLGGEAPRCSHTSSAHGSGTLTAPTREQLCNICSEQSNSRGASCEAMPHPLAWSQQMNLLRS